MSEWPRIVTEWQSAWASLDADRIVDLYTEDAEHMSHVVTERMGISSGTLKSRAAIRLYVDTSVKRLKSFRADIISVISDGDDSNGRAAVEYWRIINGNEGQRTRVIERIEWHDGKLTSCRVFHF
ncbi:MAG: nuclear transport factor 2 family protein [Parvibaculum sp.]|nr:nuclear transport factor 2 family protein [Parvibaculum sp.]